MKNIHTETETAELKAEVTTSLHCETKKKQPKDIRESTLIYSVMIHEWPANDKYLPRLFRS